MESDVQPEWPPPAVPAARHRVLIGPVNSAGQGRAWAEATSRHCKGVAAQNMTFRRPGTALNFPADYVVANETFRHDRKWSKRFQRHVTDSFTHVVIESNASVFGAGGATSARDVPVLRDAGVEVALLAHGSDVRIPSVHSAWEPWSPFPSLDSDYVAKLEKRSRAAAEYFANFLGPVFVSTPALLRFVPNARWLPVVIDIDHWRHEPSSFSHERPVVVHAPSNSALKGSDQLDPILEDLSGRGWIDYRRVQGVPPAQMPDVYRDADVMVDLVGTANYGAAACEAMASGAVVVSHVSDFVRAQVERETGRRLPIVEATPATLTSVIERLLADRDSARGVAADGLAFVGEVHDGRTSARVFGDELIGGRRRRSAGRPAPETRHFPRRARRGK
ncbi:MAG TPA: hypothetical protein VK964_20250 [Nocardioidaceae bacterium]|nr:hypothetical protein [Nocardioidaceae bacterium]